MRRVVLLTVLLVALAGCTAPEPIVLTPRAADEPVPTAVSVPAIGAQSTLIPLGLTPEGALEVPDVHAPQQAGWFSLGVVPGEKGPAVLAGHVDGEVNGQRGQPGVFHDLQQLAVGDPILIDRLDGSQLRFLVERVELFDKSTFPTAEVYGNTQRPELRLITCGGTFDHGARSYEKNTVVFAGLAA